MMFKKVVVASCLLVASMASQAGIIEYAGYKNDTSGTCASTEKDCKYNIVTHGALEWLKWDVTQGMAVNAAINTYKNAGWRLASHVEMASLFNDFKFGSRQWEHTPDFRQFGNQKWNAEEDVGAVSHFMKLFGVNLSSGFLCGEIPLPNEECFLKTDPRLGVGAYYGRETSVTGVLPVAEIWSDATSRRTTQGRRGQLITVYPQYDENYGLTEGATINGESKLYGVALVRSQSAVPVAVSTPASIGLFALGLLAVGFRRRQTLGR